MKRKFNGSFDTQCQEESVPISLKVLINMVLNGPNIKSQSGSSSISQPALTTSAFVLQQLEALQGGYRNCQAHPTARNTTAHLFRCDDPYKYPET